MNDVPDENESQEEYFIPETSNESTSSSQSDEKEPLEQDEKLQKSVSFTPISKRTRRAAKKKE